MAYKHALSPVGQVSDKKINIPKKPSNPLLSFAANDFMIINLKKSITDTPDEYKHAAHIIIYSKNEKYRASGVGESAHILMEIRDDGGMGFPGGFLDGNESILNGLRRELVEELALDLTQYKYNLSLSDHLVSHVSDKMKLVLHFFSKEVTTTELTEIENNSLNAENRGNEIRAVFQVPLVIQPDGFRGLPIFLANQFGGNGRNQLIYALENLQLLPEEELRPILKIFNQFQSAL